MANSTDAPTPAIDDRMSHQPAAAPHTGYPALLYSKVCVKSIQS